MPIRLVKNILKSSLIILGTAACDQGLSTSDANSTLACNQHPTLNIEGLKRVYSAVINNNTAESLSGRSKASLKSLRPTMSEQDISAALRELDEFSSNPTETTRLLDDIQTHLHGLSNADAGAIDKFEQARALWKQETLKEEKILDATEKFAFWKNTGLTFQDLYQIVAEKLSDVDLERAFNAYFLNDFGFVDFFLNNSGMNLFRLWVKEGLSSDGNSEFTSILKTLLLKDESNVSAQQINAVKRRIDIFFQGKNLEMVDESTKSLILNLFDSYAKNKQLANSSSEVASYLYDVMSGVRKQWQNAALTVDDDVVSDLKPLIPFVYTLRRNIYTPKLFMAPRMSAGNTDALSEQRLVWSLISLDIINNPTRYLNEILSLQKIREHQEIVRLLKRYNYAPLMKERATIEQINEKLNKIPDEQVRTSLQNFIRIAKLAGSAGLISAPIWVPLAIVFTLVPDK